LSAKPTLKRRLGCVAGLLVLGLCIYGGVMSRAQWVPAGNVGVIYSANGGLRPEVITPRRIFVPWMSQLYVYPTMVKAAIYTNDDVAGEVKGADAVQVTTNDNANTPFDIAVWYHVEAKDVHTVFNSFRAIPIEDIQSQHIRAAVRQAASVVGTEYDAFALMGPKRGEASEKLKTQLVGILGRKGITIDRAEFAGAYPSQDITARITSRVNSLTELKISAIKQQIAQVQRDTALISARANAEAQGMASAQTKDRSLDLLRLEADEAALEKWDGHLPSIQVKPGQTVVLTPDAIAALGARGAKR
jgi:hypothetical protein